MLRRTHGRLCHEVFVVTPSVLNGRAGSGGLGVPMAEASPASLALVPAITRNISVSLQPTNAAVERLEVS